ncbi:MAG: hypothetical protein JW801_18775 [Bacteroidales bacterium]|nr:hypothetical protein [Bacteroidales bacterium]
MRKLHLSVYRFLLLALMFIPGALSAQKGVEDGSKYGHGEDSVRCIRALTISHEFAKDREYETALPHWKIIFDECPLATKNIYIDGVKIYKDKIRDDSPEEELNRLMDTLMLIYDRRIQYFGEKGNVRGRQGIDLLRYGRDKIEIVEKAYGYLKESLELDKHNTRDAVVASFFSSSIVLFNSDRLDVGAVIDDYIFVSDLLDAMIENDPDPELVKLRHSTDENFDQQGPTSCEELINYFEPQFEEKKSDGKYLELVVEMLESRDCKEDGFYYAILTEMGKQKPTPQLAERLGIMSAEKGNYELAITYFENAIEMDSIEDNKADYTFGIAKCYKAMNNRPNARIYARKALSIRPAWGEPYLLIGELYAESQDVCNSLSLPNSIYWVAVDMFEKARSVDPTAEERARNYISNYSRFYPDEDKAFFVGVNKGDTYNVGCWINENTKARF